MPRRPTLPLTSAVDGRLPVGSRCIASVIPAHRTSEQLNTFVQVNSLFYSTSKYKAPTKQRQRTLLLIFDKPEDEGNKLPEHAGNYKSLHAEAASLPKRVGSSTIALRQRETRDVIFFRFNPISLCG
jgi:hypothetical protein